MAERGEQCGLSKRNICVFLILVGIAILCMLLMMYTLFYARPHASETIENGPHSSLRLDPSSTVHS